MADVNWPSAPFPQYLQHSGYGESPPDNVLRSQMEVGPAKVRPRFTAGVRVIKGVLQLTKAQVAELDDFYVDDLEQGTLQFDWLHPRTGGAATFRFVRPPAYSTQGGDAWTADLELEILPS